MFRVLWETQLRQKAPGEEGSVMGEVIEEQKFTRWQSRKALSEVVWTGCGEGGSMCV